MKSVTYFMKSILSQLFHKQHTHWIRLRESISILQIPIPSKNKAKLYNIKNISSVAHKHVLCF